VYSVTEKKVGVVLVAGAGGRIGSSVARALVGHGFLVACIDRSEEALRSLRLQLPEECSLLMSGDAGEPDEVDACLLRCVNRFGKIDAAIYASYPRSSGWGKKFEEIRKTDLDEDLTNQLGGAILFSQRVLKWFIEQGHGNLIHFSSIMGVCTPRFDNYHGTNMVSPLEYTAIKSAIIALTKYLAKYYKGNNIQVNCISPGGILAGQPEEFLRRYSGQCNSKGMLDADDIVGAVLYLLSTGARYVNGQNIVVDDGWSL